MIESYSEITAVAMLMKILSHPGHGNHPRRSPVALIQALMIKAVATLYCQKYSLTHTNN